MTYFPLCFLVVLLSFCGYVWLDYATRPNRRQRHHDHLIPGTPRSQRG